jgi:ADP-ribose pyrophosphatase YjhB (NUDIX family)
METVLKVCAGVVRPRGDATELLVFEHPTAGIQLPKGGLRRGETPEAGVLRELREETGLAAVEVPRRVGVWERHAGAGPDGSGALERHVWHVFLVQAPTGAPDRWTHEAYGSVAEAGLRFRCSWVPMTGALDVVHPLFRPVVALLGRALAPVPSSDSR